MGYAAAVQRNDRLVHGKAGPLALDQHWHRQLNLRLEEEVISRCTVMHQPFRYLIRNYPLHVLTKIYIPSKKHRLASVHLTREEFAAPAYQPDAYSNERTFMSNLIT